MLYQILTSQAISLHILRICCCADFSRSGVQSRVLWLMISVSDRKRLCKRSLPWCSTGFSCEIHLTDHLQLRSQDLHTAFGKTSSAINGILYPSISLGSLIAAYTSCHAPLVPLLTRLQPPKNGNPHPSTSLLAPFLPLTSSSPCVPVCYSRHNQRLVLPNQTSG